MKTLKYLLLLLAVAVALPAMAQKEEEMAAPLLQPEVDFAMEMDEDAPAGTAFTKGAFKYRVFKDGANLVAEAERTNGKFLLRTVKGADGTLQKYCEGPKGICPSGFEPVQQFAIDDKIIVKEKDTLQVETWQKSTKVSDVLLDIKK
ncbi:MAG: hypothetical protein J5601_01990 [Elusimicrobiaceae bacterium]|nr:hypothetical protein [Elusimicrobiaceae bacterium]